MQLRELLKEFVLRMNDVPARLWGNAYRNRVIWLIDNELGIMSNSSIVLGTKIKKKYKHTHAFREDYFYRTTNQTAFFRSVPENIAKREFEIAERISDLMMFSRFDLLTAKEILKCRNIEIRRMLLDRYGNERLVKELKGIVIDKNGESELIKIDLGSQEEIVKIVKVIDPSTSAVYFLRVPLNMKTCKQAVAWTFQFQESEYEPLIET